MESPSAPLTERRYLLPFILVTSLFFLWALGVNLNDILIPHLKKAFSLTDFQSSLIQSAFFGGYFIAALPAGWVMERVGYKKGILIGLLVCATGAFLFIPASYIRIYGFFLFALFIMACGQSFLEVAANPYVTILGPARKFGAQTEFRAIVQRRRRGSNAIHRRRLHPLRHRTHARRASRDAARPRASLSRTRSQHGQSSVPGHRRNFSRRGGADLFFQACPKCPRQESQAAPRKPKSASAISGPIPI